MVRDAIVLIALIAVAPVHSRALYLFRASSLMIQHVSPCPQTHGLATAQSDADFWTQGLSLTSSLSACELSALSMERLNANAL